MLAELVALTLTALSGAVVTAAVIVSAIAAAVVVILSLALCSRSPRAAAARGNA